MQFKLNAKEVENEKLRERLSSSPHSKYRELCMWMDSPEDDDEEDELRDLIEERSCKLLELIDLLLDRLKSLEEFNNATYVAGTVETTPSKHVSSKKRKS